MVTKNINYWLEEKELKTPEHDEMVIWTFNHTKKILDELGIAIELNNCEKELESPIVQLGLSNKYSEGSKNIIGFLDLKIRPVRSSFGSDLYFEVKPHITSFGNVMRQINYYRTYLNGKFIIVTKTKGLKELFESQNVFVYEFEDGN